MLIYRWRNQETLSFCVVLSYRRCGWKIVSTVIEHWQGAQHSARHSTNVYPRLREEVKRDWGHETSLRSWSWYRAGTQTTSAACQLLTWARPEPQVPGHPSTNVRQHKILSQAKKAWPKPQTFWWFILILSAALSGLAGVGVSLWSGPRAWGVWPPSRHGIILNLGPGKCNRRSLKSPFFGPP